MAENALAEEVVEEEHTEQVEGSEETQTEVEPEPQTFTEDDVNRIVQKRLDRDRKARAEEKTKREQELEAEVQRLKTQRQSAEGRPNIEDFETDADFYDALTDWKLEQRDRKASEERTQKEQAAARQQEERTFAEKVQATREAGSEKYEDYDKVIASMPPNVMDKSLADAVLETSSPEDIAYHLGKNPKEAEKISKMSPLKKAIALGKIEARLTNKPQSSAPPPINPIKGKSSTEFDPDKLLEENPKEWIRLRNEGKI